MASDDSPRETDRLGGGDDDDLLFGRRRGCCAWMPCFGGGGRSGSPICFQRMRSAAADGGGDEPWWTRGWKKVREWSELVAGPRWKTFLRRFNRTGRRIQAAGRFRYDELSYSLNFDGGQDGHFRGGDDDEDDLLGRDFSGRFASVPASSSSAAVEDLGRPSLT